MDKNVVETIICNPAQINELRSLLEETGWEFSDLQYAHFKAKQDKLSIAAYTSGKVVVSGPKSDVANILETINSASSSGISDVIANWRDHIGVDESGKGDFFGPLVISGVFVVKDKVGELVKLGVRDSKTISDKKAIEIRANLKNIVDVEEIVIPPAKYNELYAKMNNINTMLAWGHARVIENLLERHPNCTLAMSDQFAKQESRVKNALMEKGKKIELIQMHRAESDLAVAAASICARGRFLLELSKLSKEFGLDLPKGAGDQVITVGKEFSSKHGVERLDQVGKLHFQTTEKISN